MENHEKETHKKIGSEKDNEIDINKPPSLKIIIISLIILFFFFYLNDKKEEVIAHVCNCRNFNVDDRKFYEPVNQTSHTGNNFDVTANHVSDKNVEKAANKLINVFYGDR